MPSSCRIGLVDTQSLSLTLASLVSFESMKVYEVVGLILAKSTGIHAMLDRSNE